MATSPLSKREIQVLLALVKVHVALGVPVGSQTLNQRENLGVSPATIRNTLASLEEKGYISQPHVSAGRIPSEKGYRFYVQRCMATADAGLDEAEITLRQQLEAAQQEGDYEEILHQLARTIGDLSNQLGLVLAPRFNQGIFHKLELWRLGGASPVAHRHDPRRPDKELDGRSKLCSVAARFRGVESAF